MLTYGGEHCGGVVKGARKLPRHPRFVRSVEENHLLEEAEVMLEENLYKNDIVEHEYFTSEILYFISI